MLLILLVVLYILIRSNDLKVTLINLLVVLRGILAPNCFWYNISDKILSDSSGVNLYNTYKRDYGDFVMSNMFRTKVYIVTNIKYVKTILDNSPNLFSVGKLKKTFFKSFMKKNVGVST